MFGFRKPCVLDLKMGTRQRTLGADAAKEQRQRLKSLETTSHALGFRLCGCQVPAVYHYIIHMHIHIYSDIHLMIVIYVLYIIYIIYYVFYILCIIYVIYVDVRAYGHICVFLYV